MTGSVLNISDAGSLGLHAMMLLASAPDSGPQRVSTIASRLDVSESHLSKVLQRLTRVGLVTSRRGPRGGYSLAQEPHQVTLAQIYEAIDGPLGGNPCLLDRQTCALDCCVLGGLLHDLDRRVKNHLRTTTLADICNNNK